MTGESQQVESRTPPIEDSQTTDEEKDLSVTATDLNDVPKSKLLKQLVDRINNVEEDNEELKEQFEQLERRVSILESRADHLNDGIESVEIELRQSNDDHSRSREDLEKRINTLEAELGIEEWKGAETVQKPSCELERIAQMPEDFREKEMSRSVNRAVIIWNHFDEWSQPISKGQILSGSEIQKLLKTRLDKDLEWVQVHRVMKAFNKNTPDSYSIVDAKDSGKSIVRDYKGR